MLEENRSKTINNFNIHKSKWRFLKKKKIIFEAI